MCDTLAHTSLGSSEKNNLGIKRQLVKSQVDLPHNTYTECEKSITQSTFIMNVEMPLEAKKSLMEQILVITQRRILCKLK